MRIILSPQRREDSLVVIKAGATLDINGELFDFSPMSEGSTLPRAAVKSLWVAGDVEMSAGEIVVTLLLPLPANYSQAQAFPVDLVNVPDGIVAFPPPLPQPLNSVEVSPE